MNNYIKGLLFSVLATLAFASNEVLGTYALNSGATTSTIITVRSLIAAVLFGLTILIFNKKWFKIEKKDIWRIVLPGILLLAELTFFWTGLSKLKEISVMLSLYYLCPIWAALVYAILTKKMPKKNIILAVTTGVVGIMLVSQYIPNFVFKFDILGGVSMLLAGFFWAMLFISAQYAMKKYHQFTVLFYMFVIVLIGTLFIQHPAIALAQLANPITLKYTVILGIFTAYLAYLLLMFAIKFNQAVKTNTLDILAGVSSVILAMFFLNQWLTVLQIIGLGLVLSITYILKK